MVFRLSRASHMDCLPSDRRWLRSALLTAVQLATFILQVEPQFDVAHAM